MRVLDVVCGKKVMVAVRLRWLVFGRVRYRRDVAGFLQQYFRVTQITEHFISFDTIIVFIRGIEFVAVGFLKRIFASKTLFVKQKNKKYKIKILY